MGLSRKFGRALGKMVEPIPGVRDVVEAVGEMGESIPVRPVADYHRGLKEGASAAELRAAEERAQRERKAAREAQERANRAAEERNQAVREAAKARAEARAEAEKAEKAERERKEWERQAAALDAERTEQREHT